MLDNIMVYDIERRHRGNTRELRGVDVDVHDSKSLT